MIGDTIRLFIAVCIAVGTTVCILVALANMGLFP